MLSVCRYHIVDNLLYQIEDSNVADIWCKLEKIDLDKKIQFNKISHFLSPSEILQFSRII